MTLTVGRVAQVRRAGSRAGAGCCRAPDSGLAPGVRHLAPSERRLELERLVQGGHATFGRAAGIVEEVGGHLTPGRRSGVGVAESTLDRADGRRGIKRRFRDVGEQRHVVAMNLRARNQFGNVNPDDRPVEQQVLEPGGAVIGDQQVRGLEIGADVGAARQNAPADRKRGLTASGQSTPPEYMSRRSRDRSCSLTMTLIGRPASRE